MASSDSDHRGVAARSDAPLIGLTTYRQQAQTGVWDVEAAFLPAVYLNAVTNAGGIAVLLPPQAVSPDIAARVVDQLDGLIITGGRDVDPGRYGQQPHEATDEPQPQRDQWEEALLDAAIERGVPFLGICRGMQLLNVARGGTLLQHLPDVVGDTRYNAGEGRFTVNHVHVDEQSALGELLGREQLPVKSYHHQALDELGDGLRVTARSEDGIVQAVQLEGVPFGLAVQWHPEEDAAEEAHLFEGLVAAARDYRKVSA